MSIRISEPRGQLKNLYAPRQIGPKDFIGDPEGAPPLPSDDGAMVLLVVVVETVVVVVVFVVVLVVVVVDIVRGVSSENNI